MMQKHIHALLQELDPNPQRPELKATPRRVEEALKFLTKGYQANLKELIQNSLYPCAQQQLILVRDIEFYSICEHHLLPFFGHCHIAYLPNQSILGLSKFAEIVEVFARRLQTQENLGAQIANYLEEYLSPRGLAVFLDAEHLCMKMQGIQKQESRLWTQILKGELSQVNPHQALMMNQIYKS